MNTFINTLGQRLISHIRRWPVSEWAKTILIGGLVAGWFVGAFFLSALVMQLLWGWIVPDIAPGTLAPTISFGSACKIVLVLVLLRLDRLGRFRPATTAREVGDAPAGPGAAYA